MLELRLLAAPALRRGGQAWLPLPPKDALLLALLALDGPQPREQLATLLWPHVAAGGARANLRQRIRKLQQLSQQGLLADDGGVLALGGEPACDLAQLGPLIEGDAQAARGALLGELVFEDEDGAQRWLNQARQRVAAQRNAALRAAAGLRIGRGVLDEAVPWLERLAAENPWDESSARELMLLHHRRGDSGAALQVFARLAQALERNLGARPGAETQQLARLLQAGQAGPAPAPQPSATRMAVRQAWPQPPLAQAAPPGRSAIAAMLQRPSRLLGREAEWQALERVAAVGGIVLVQGTAGMGKTRLLGDFARHAGIGLALRAHDGDRNVPYALLARWVGQREAQAARLPGWAVAELARLHPALGEAAPGPASALRLCQAFAPLAGADTAVWIDDLHFADDASLELLPKLLQGVHCSLLATRGPAVPPPLAAWLEALPERVRVLTLAPWDEPTLTALLASEVLPLAEPARWAALMRRHTGGHPLLVLESLRAVLVDVAADAGQRLAPPAALPMPPALLELLRARVRRLSAAAQSVLQVAALAADAFALEVCAQVLAQPLDALAAPWAELQAEALMSAEGRSHDLVLEAVREELLAPRAAALHAALARALADRGAAAARLALHWDAAGEPARAAQAHELAATAADAMSRGGEERRHWAEAARCWQAAAEPERALEAGLQELVCLVNAGQPAEALARAAVLHAWPATPRQWARLLSAEANAQAMLRRFDEALAMAPRVVAAARAGDDLQSLSEGLTLTAICAALVGRRAEAEEALRACAQLELPADHWRLRLNHDTRCADALMYLGRLRDALPLLRACLEANQRPERRLHLITQHNNLALLHQRLGESGPALHHAGQTLALARQLGQEAGQAALSVRVLQAAVRAAHLGDYAAAIEDFEHVLTQFAPEQAMLAALTQVQLAWAWCQLGQAARAWALARDAARSPHLLLRVRAWALMADLQRLLDTGQAGEPPAGWRDCGDPSTLGHAEINLARGLPAPQAHAAFAALSRTLQQQGLEGLAAAARAFALAPMAQEAPAELPGAARAARAELAERQSSATYRPELLLALHDGLQAAGDPAAAQACLDEARAWVLRAAEGLPGAWRESFLARNRVNAVLMAGALRPAPADR